MSEKIKKGSVSYRKMEADYFTKRGLKRHAGAWSLWALGVGAVISGHFSGWNLGIEQAGWGGMFIATILILIMYGCLTQSVSEMSAALPHTGGAYSFARSSMGPWGGFITGLVENMEFIITPAVIVFFISSYMSSIFDTGPEMLPVWWGLFYIIFVVLNIIGVELSFKLAVFVTVLSLLVLAFFWISAISAFSWGNLFNIASDVNGKMVEVDAGSGSFLPFGVMGVLGAMPFAVWLFLAIEQLPLAAEESQNPEVNMPKGLTWGILTLMVSAFLVLITNAGVIGSFNLATLGDPMYSGFSIIFGDNLAKILASLAVIGLISSFHTIIFAFGRQIYSLSRAGYIPQFLSLTNGQRKTPYVALIAGSVIGFAVLMIAYLTQSEEASGSFIGGALLNMAVFSAMISYVMQSVSYILLKKNKPNLNRPFVSPFGITGAVATIVIALVTIYYQVQDPTYQVAVYSAIIYLIVGVIYFVIFGRHNLILSPEEEFAMEKEKK